MQTIKDVVKTNRQISAVYATPFDHLINSAHVAQLNKGKFRSSKDVDHNSVHHYCTIDLNNRVIHVYEDPDAVLPTNKEFFLGEGQANILSNVNSTNNPQNISNTTNDDPSLSKKKWTEKFILPELIFLILLIPIGILYCQTIEIPKYSFFLLVGLSIFSYICSAFSKSLLLKSAVMLLMYLNIWFFYCDMWNYENNYNVFGFCTKFLFIGSINTVLISIVKTYHILRGGNRKIQLLYFLLLVPTSLFCFLAYSYDAYFIFVDLIYLFFLLAPVKISKDCKSGFLVYLYYLSMMFTIVIILFSYKVLFIKSLMSRKLVKYACFN